METILSSILLAVDITVHTNASISSEFPIFSDWQMAKCMGPGHFYQNVYQKP